MKLRKILAAVMACSIVCGAPAAMGAYKPSYELTANAADVLYSGKCGDKASWTLDSEGTLTISGTGDINEESFWNSYKNETGIESYNDLWDSLNRVVVKKGITSLPDNLFAKCTNIVSVSLPDSLKSIGSCTFCQCKKLETIKIPESVEYIGSKAFDSTKWLYNKSEESSPVIVNSFLLYGADCSGDVVIPNGVTVISDSAFGWSKITSIEIPNSVTKIEAMAFQGCNELKSITILNPNCEIEDHPGTIFNDYDEEGTGYIYSGVIKGYSGSTAEAYAKKHNRTFEALTPETPTSTTITTTTQITTTTTTTTTTTATETETTSAATTTATAGAPSVNDERIVGQWYVYMISWRTEKGATDLLPNDDQYIVSFKNDGTFTLNTKNDTGYSEDRGTWFVSGDDLTIIRPDGVSDSAVLSDSWTFKGQKWIVVQDNKEFYLVRGGKFTNPETTTTTQPVTTTTIETTTTESTTTETTTAATTTESATTTTSTTVPTRPEVSFGDPTGDGKIDAKDASFVLVEYAKLSTVGVSTLSEAVKKAADVNKDGKIDAKDASAILRYYAYVSTGGDKSISEFLTNWK